MFLTALVMVMGAASHSVLAQSGQWCLRDDEGRTNCGFATQQQCLTTARGAGGSCQQNNGNFNTREPRWRQNRRRSDPNAVPPPGGKSSQ
jgi:hypothetical protein